jgi:hypothetical protein
MRAAFFAARIARDGFFDAFDVLKDALHAPEAPTREDGGFHVTTLTGGLV